MYRRILVPLDGSAFSEQALPQAMGMARRTGAVIELVHVHQPGLAIGLTMGAPVPLTPAAARMEEDERAWLAGLASRLTRAGVRAEYTRLTGSPANTLAAYTAQSGADLVVMTTHGRSAATRMWLGSVADRLVRQLSVPVLLVRPRDGAYLPDEARKIECVLVPVDGSAAAEEILPFVTALAGTQGVRYIVVEVLPREAAMVRPTVDEPEAPEAPALRRDVEDAAEMLRQAGCTVETELLFHDSPAVALLEFATVRGADMIAISTHGKGRAERLLLGSVADKVVRGSTVPVLVYRPAGETAVRDMWDRALSGAYAGLI